jgi:hypothetical protein
MSSIDQAEGASIPSALERGWPIPSPRDAEGLFCDLAEEGAQTGLLALMTGISEEYWCASWMSDLEYALWLARETGPRPYGMGVITERQCALLRLLSEEANGWWHWTEDGARFARLETWQAHVDARKAQP